MFWNEYLFLVVVVVLVVLLLLLLLVEIVVVVFSTLTDILDIWNKSGYANYQYWPLGGAFVLMV